MTVKTFFSPLRLPFTLPDFGLPKAVRIVVISAFRFGVLAWLGPVWYLVSRGRVGPAIGLFLVSIVFYKAGIVETGLRYLTYLCVLAECIQLGVSFYVMRVRASRPAPTEFVEEVDIVDQHGYLIRRTQHSIDPDTL